MSDVLEEGSVTAGALLRDARQAAGIHIAALAVALKVPVSKLEALEADNYQALPDTVFVRALASSMCRTLKIDPGPVLSLLPQAKSPRLSTDGGGINAPVKSTVGKSSSSSSSSSLSARPASRSVSLIVLALLAGALALVFLPREQHESKVPGTATSSQEAPSDAAAPAAVVAPTASEPQAVPAGVAAPAAARASTDGQAEAVVGAPAAAANSGASAPMNAASVAATSGGVLVLRARGETWVQVRDATGAVALQRSLVAGEVVSVAGPAPLAVVVGRADMTEVVVRGKAFDLAAVSRENVARFEVK
jgi:cytoskeleton protein RodZ